MQKITNWCE
jgi:dynein heavy chain